MKKQSVISRGSLANSMLYAPTWGGMLTKRLTVAPWGIGQSVGHALQGPPAISPGQRPGYIENALHFLSFAG